jgi:glutamyl-tRNA synthetase/glutamyl-Q tRNA(Asp) synthetase
VNAIYVWGLARAHGWDVLLRIEDHDRIRCRPEYDVALLEDLQWLGFIAGSKDPAYTHSRAGPALWTRQSEQPEAYERALDRLRRTAHVYACDCSRKDIRLRQGFGGHVGGEYYPGFCRARGLDERPGRSLRVAIEPGVERFDDLLLGPQEQSPASQCGDLLLRDRDGHWTYQFAVTVDDVRQQITHVVRGADLLSSTGRQIRLARILGRAAPPRFLHHPLILKSSGEKLSKAAGDTGVRDLRRQGLAPAEVIGRAAAACGLVASPRPVAADEVGWLFRAG